MPPPVNKPLCRSAAGVRLDCERRGRRRGAVGSAQRAACGVLTGGRAGRVQPPPIGRGCCRLHTQRRGRLRPRARVKASRCPRAPFRAAGARAGATMLATLLAGALLLSLPSAAGAGGRRGAGGGSAGGPCAARGCCAARPSPRAAAPTHPWPCRARARRWPTRSGAARRGRGARVRRRRPVLHEPPRRHPRWRGRAARGLLHRCARRAPRPAAAWAS
jgi:hypothetical protein